MAGKLARLCASKMQDQKGCCYYCGQEMWREDAPDFCRRHRVGPRLAMLFRCTAEHLLPVCKGGGARADNIVAACWFCNVTRHRAKQPRSPARYRIHVQTRLAKGRWVRLPAP